MGILGVTIVNIELLKEALNASWSKDTSYWSDRNDWTVDKKETGQCTITAMIVFDYLGGTIYRGYSTKYELFHYWNEVNGEKIDLTFNQFIGSKNDIVFTKIVTKRKEDLMKISNVKNRYTKLKTNVDRYLSGKKNL